MGTGTTPHVAYGAQGLAARNPPPPPPGQGDVRQVTVSPLGGNGGVIARVFQGRTTVANTCAPKGREWYHTRSPGENILGLKKAHNPLYTALGERTSQNAHG